jgi:hypothetical protein
MEGTTDSRRAAVRLRSVHAALAAGSRVPVVRALEGAHQQSLQPVPDAEDQHFGMSTRHNTPLPETNLFGVSTIEPGFGILPKKVRAEAEALQCLRRDGAVILAGLTTELEGMDAYRDTAYELPTRLFGDDLLAMAQPVSVGIPNKPNTEEMKAYYRQHWGEKVGIIPPWGPNCAHTDGEAYGDRFPPYLFLLFAHQCAEGGDNALVDSKFLLEELERELPDVAQRLRTVPVDQTQYGADGANGIACISPIVQTVPGANGDRLMVKLATGGQVPATAIQKRTAKAGDGQLLGGGGGGGGGGDDDDGCSAATTMIGAALSERTGWDEDEAIARDQRMIDAYKDAAFAATAHAPRFKVQPGEALIVDNYRAMHVREGYRDLDRRSWRVWMWAAGACYGGPNFLNDPDIGGQAFAQVVWA